MALPGFYLPDDAGPVLSQGAVDRRCKYILNIFLTEYVHLHRLYFSNLADVS
jgi:hypothetical protein